MTLRRRSPTIAFLLIATIGIVLPIATYRSGEQADEARFERLADEAADRLSLRIARHVSLLEATRAFFKAREGRVSRFEFAEFINALDIDGNYDGVQGIGFASMLQTGAEADAERQIIEGYGVPAKVHPATAQDRRAVIVMLEPPDERNRVALGYDMYSDATRREAMQRADSLHKTQASGRVELVQEIDNAKQAGFLVYLPLYRGSAPEGSSPSGSLAGYVYAPYRAGDLLNAALIRTPLLPLSVDVFDGDPSEERLLYSSGDSQGPPSAGFETSRKIDVAGRSWTIIMRPSRDYEPGNELRIALVLGALALLTAIAVATSLRAQIVSLDATHELLQTRERAADEKDLLLQEMKHRIKNSIARILGIARQTAASSENLDAFIHSFSNRLQSMASSQDLLTRSKSESAEIVELLKSELTQVFGNSLNEVGMSGPKVVLNARATQALGLIFHELATNALKYGNLGADHEAVQVGWELAGGNGGRRLVINWREPENRAEATKQGSGFGTRLVSALVTHELGGEIAREYGAAGFSVRISAPADRILA